MYKTLKVEMCRNNISVHWLAKEIDVTDKTLRNKINEITEFTWPEVCKIRKLVAPYMSLDELFEKEDGAA